MLWMNVTVWDPDFSECLEVKPFKVEDLQKDEGSSLRMLKLGEKPVLEQGKEPAQNLLQKHLWNDYALSYQQVLVSNLHVGLFKVDHIAG